MTPPPSDERLTPTPAPAPTPEPAPAPEPVARVYDGPGSNRLFPLRFLGWKMRMLKNILAERREFVVLSSLMGFLGLGGTLLWVGFVTRALGNALEKNTPEELDRNLNTVLFAALVAFGFMALANLVSGFFSQARMEERERLMGPLSPFSLFLTEVLDALRLPMGLLLVGGVLPLGLVTLQGGSPCGCLGWSVWSWSVSFLCRRWRYSGAILP